MDFDLWVHCGRLACWHRGVRHYVSLGNILATRTSVNDCVFMAPGNRPLWRPRYILNRKSVNIAFLSIGIDYFQVLAMFSRSNVKWPEQLNQFFLMLSAFNFNIDITAPEVCAPPSLTLPLSTLLCTLPAARSAALFCAGLTCAVRYAKCGLQEQVVLCGGPSRGRCGLVHSVPHLASAEEASAAGSDPETQLAPALPYWHDVRHDVSEALLLPRFPCSLEF